MPVDFLTETILDPFKDRGPFYGYVRDLTTKIPASITGSCDGSQQNYGENITIDITQACQGGFIPVNSPLPIFPQQTGKGIQVASRNLGAYVQPTLAQQATLRMAPDGEYYAEFDGVDDQYVRATNSSGWTLSGLQLPPGLGTTVSWGCDGPLNNWLGSQTVIVVLECRTAKGGHLFGRPNNALGSGRMDLVLSGGFPRFHTFQWFTGACGMRQLTGSTNIPLNTRVIGCMRITQGVSHDIFFNGVLDGTLSIAGCAISSSASRQEISAGGALCPTMNLYYLSHYPFSMDDLILQKITRFLGNRFGVVVP